jgi:ribosomal protein S18 acetylase RimI-like enzyme
MSIASLFAAMVGLLVSRSLGAPVQAATLLVAALLLLDGSIAELAVDPDQRGRW